ncbi:hypothetical protein BvMPK_3648 [Phocaeicola vulgatus]|uniref:Uncharacterized protein n=2 Tax=Phocaeicola vulgatus TaxID=821 RepID=A0A0P0M547_PHOVU|nr:hypothetical protein BvMPK_3648 [Phocaeicola vulgatus]
MGICGEQRFHCILRTDRTVYNQTSKEIYLMQKKEYHFFILFLCWQQTNTIIHRLMKTTILLGLLLTLTVSCKHHSNPVTTEENFHTQEANRLVAEARNLWLPPLDSTFFFNDSEHISINDKEIWAKLDSALAIDPTNIKVYVGRISYLSACKKYHEILSVLRQAEKQSTLNADLWSMKAMFEDYFGDSLTAQKNYRSADSAYAILIKEYATDSLRYAGSRINRALNMALMTDNIAILEEEVELTKKIFPKPWKGPDSSFYGKNKKDFFDKCFNVRKK